jgi:aryl-alcohol dehydrogenase-like predicted oxidoreductase
MRLEPDEVDPVVGAAVMAGITVFDTARAYGDGERLLVDALRRAGGAERARIVTKGGMARPGGAWVPDGRAKAIRADCEASLAALDGLPIDLYLVHAPDPRVPWKTTVRALGRLAEEGLVARVGVSNVNRRQLDEALELAPVAAVEVPLSPFDDRAVRGGVLERCDELGLTFIAHSPLGGPKRAGRVDAAETLAWLLALSPVVVPIPGARRPETVRASAAAAAAVPAPVRRSPTRAARRTDADVVLVMGVPGAGKSRIDAGYAERGYLRLNRDERGGSLRELAAALEDELAAGARAVVLDNTYLSRASRNDVIEAASRYGASVRCVWLDTPLAQAQVNLVQRLLDRFGELPPPVELRQLARREQGVLAPTSQMRAFRELEPPSVDEGFAAVERVSFERASSGGPGGVFVAARALSADGWEDAIAAAEPAAPHLVYDWNPDGDASVLDAAAASLAAMVGGPVETALCAHPAGPPVCWCRPPLPGLPLAFARRHGIDPAASVVVGSGPSHRTLAETLGARYVPI